MKKVIFLLVGILLASVFFACSKDTDNSDLPYSESAPMIISEPQSTTGSIDDSTNLENSSESPSDSQATPSQSQPIDDEPESVAIDPESVDVDLTEMSSTMIYAEVYNMMFEQENYLGKTIKIRGLYAVYSDESNTEHYHAVIITDALACCAQGLEFVWLGEHSYPDDYPEMDAEIEITGVFCEGTIIYEENEYPYYYLETHDITKL